MTADAKQTFTRKATVPGAHRGPVRRTASVRRMAQPRPAQKTVETASPTCRHSTGRQTTAAMLSAAFTTTVQTETRSGYTKADRVFTEAEALETLEQAAAAWEEENLVSGEIKERTATMEIDGQQAVYHVDYLCEMDIASPRKLDVVFAENDK